MKSNWYVIAELVYGGQVSEQRFSFKNVVNEVINQVKMNKAILMVYSRVQNMEIN